MTDDPRRLRELLDDPAGLCMLLGLAVSLTRRQAGGVFAHCPWHKERTPSCSVRLGPDRTIAVYCFGCHASGDALDLIAEVNGLDRRRDFRKVLEEAAALAGVDLEERAPRRRRRVPSVSAVAHLIDAGAADFLAGRTPRSALAVEFASAPILTEALDLLADVDEIEAARVAEMAAETDVANDVWDLLTAAVDVRYRRAWEAACTP